MELHEDDDKEAWRTNETEYIRENSPWENDTKKEKKERKKEKTRGIELVYGIRRATMVITLCPVTSDSDSLRELFVMHARRETGAHGRIRKSARAVFAHDRSASARANAYLLFVSPRPERVLLAEKYASRCARFVPIVKARRSKRGSTGGQIAMTVDISSINKVSAKYVYTAKSRYNKLDLDLEIKFVTPKILFHPIIRILAQNSVGSLELTFVTVKFLLHPYLRKVNFAVAHIK